MQQHSKEVLSSHASFSSSGIGSSDITANNSTAALMMFSTESPTATMHHHIQRIHRYTARMVTGSTANVAEAAAAAASANNEPTSEAAASSTSTNNASSSSVNQSEENDTVPKEKANNVASNSGASPFAGPTTSSSSTSALNYESSLSAPFVHDEDLANEVLSKAGPANTYMRVGHSHDVGNIITGSESVSKSFATGSNKNNYNNSSTYASNNQNKTTSRSNNNGYANYESDCANIIKIDDDLSSESLASNSIINQDPDPIHIMKPNTQNVVYKQQVNIRYLQPPTPPPPAPIIIREKQLPTPPAQPPIIIRQTAPAPPTPVPLIIRERAPTPPSLGEPTIIERSIAPQAAPPRQVIIERVPPPPPKPRAIVYEKWLPYKQVQRPVIVQKIKQPAPRPPKNIIIEYERPKCVAVRQVVEEGIFRADPATYAKTAQQNSPNSEVRIVDRITDLPLEHSHILASYKLEKSKSEDMDELDQIYSEILNNSYRRNASSSTNNSGKVMNGSFANTTHRYAFGENNVYSTLSSGDCDDQVQYETVTTCVSESLANKIIAEAKAAGVCTRYCS